MLNNVFRQQTSRTFYQNSITTRIETSIIDYLTTVAANFLSEFHYNKDWNSYA